MMRHELTKRCHRNEQLHYRSVGALLAAGVIATSAGCGGGADSSEGSRTGTEAVRGRAGASASSGGRAGSGVAGRGGTTAGRGGTGGTTSASAGSKAGALQDERNLGPCEFTSSAEWLTKDGDKLLVYCNKNLGLLPLNGDQFLQLASPSNPSKMAMSADRVLYLEAMQLTSVPLTGGDPERVINVINGLQYSADRTLAVFEGAELNGKVHVFAVDPTRESSRRQIAEAGSSGAKLVPDDRHLIYSPSYGEIAIVDTVDPGQPKRLGNGVLDHVALSKSGGKLAFYDSAKDHMVLAKVDGTTTQLGDSLTAEPEVIAFTPDETALLIADNNYDPTKARAFVLSLDSGKTISDVARAKNLSTNWLFISEHGRIVSLQAADSQSSPEIWLSSATGDSKMIGTLERCQLEGSYPIVARDADSPQVAFVDVYGSFVVVDLDTGEQKAETKNLVPVGATCEAAPAWSPDGKKVLLSSCKSSNCDVILMDAGDRSRGPTLTTSIGNATNAAFSADARYVAFKSNSDVVLFDTSGSQVWKGSVLQTPYAWLDAKRFVVALPREMHLLTLR